MKLTPSLRAELKKPLGVVVKDARSIPKGRVVIAVGDVAGEKLIKSGLSPKICIYDAKTLRKEVVVDPMVRDYGLREVRVENPAGYLMPGVFDAIRKLLSLPGESRLFIEGEEDLTALAAVMEAPCGSLVVYGQPTEGMVVVEVDGRIKSKVQKILEGMENGS